MTAIARIISVGDELLVGRTSDTNATRIQRALLPHGVPVRDVLVVGDCVEAIAAALSRTDPGDLIFLCGGLGSTSDDLTRDGLAAWAGVPLEHRQDLADALKERRRARGLPCMVEVDRQALVPVGCTPIANPEGTAPALVGRLQQRLLAVLPGVPHELQALLPLVLAELGFAPERPAGGAALLRRTAQLAELPVARLTEPISRRYASLRWSWWLVDWGVDVHVRGEPGQQSLLEQAGRELDTALGDTVYAQEAVDLPRVVQDLMLGRGLTLSVAESCTGGKLGAAITAEVGSSGFFLGGVMTYADAVKSGMLAVDVQALAQRGAVSREVAEQMACGVRRELGSDYALAITGIAGPGGGTQEKPVGTTWLALAAPDGSYCGCYRYSGDRERNRQLAVAGALDALRRALLGLAVFPVARLTWGRPV